MVSRFGLGIVGVEVGHGMLPRIRGLLVEALLVLLDLVLQALNHLGRCEFH